MAQNHGPAMLAISRTRRVERCLETNRGRSQRSSCIRVHESSTQMQDEGEAAPAILQGRTGGGRER